MEFNRTPLWANGRLGIDYAATAIKELVDATGVGRPANLIEGNAEKAVVAFERALRQARQLRAGAKKQRLKEERDAKTAAQKAKQHERAFYNR